MDNQRCERSGVLRSCQRAWKTYAMARLQACCLFLRHSLCAMAQRLAHQSNLSTKPGAPKWVLTKIAGTSTPCIGRLFAGVLQLRDQTNLAATQREEFDKVYEALLAALNTARPTAKTAVELFASHSRRVSQGEIAVWRGIPFMLMKVWPRNCEDKWRP